MKKLALLLPLLPLALLTGCTENHYYTVKPATTERVYVKPTVRSTPPRKSAPSVSGENAEEFRAVEKPGSYSQ